ncbi:hypothetical protein VTO42DRAFT_1958 [Malbranchea cinnamomea]
MKLLTLLVVLFFALLVTARQPDQSRKWRYCRRHVKYTDTCVPHHGFEHQDFQGGSGIGGPEDVEGGAEDEPDTPGEGGMNLYGPRSRSRSLLSSTQKDRSWRASEPPPLRQVPGQIGTDDVPAAGIGVPWYRLTQPANFIWRAWSRSGPDRIVELRTWLATLGRADGLGSSP